MRTAIVLGCALSTLALSGCGDDPFQFEWTASPDTAHLLSLARPELNLLSAFDFVDRVPLRVESAAATGRWDIALDTEGGELVFLAPGALGIDSRAGIARLPGLTFDELTEAPSDSAAYSTEDPVVVDANSAYAVRTSRDRDRFGRLCTFFVKLQPLTMDLDRGEVSFVFDRNPTCNDRSLVPPDG